MNNLKPVQKYREANIIFSSWSMMFISLFSLLNYFDAKPKCYIF